MSYGQKLFRQAMVKLPSSGILPSETRAYYLYHTEQPIVNTPVTKYLLKQRGSVGTNISIAIASHEGYTLDDAIAIKASSV